MLFENNFKIKDSRGDTVSLAASIRAAEKVELAQMQYDPEGLYTPESFAWCEAVLDVMVQEGYLRPYKVVDRPEPNYEQDPNKIY